MVTKTGARERPGRFKNITEALSLYLITDRKRFSSQCAFYFALEDSLEAGVKSIQLREKDLSTRDLLETADWIRQLTSDYGAFLFVNDRVDVALAVGADGVHLGQESMPAYAARKAADNGLIVGVSTHSLDEAVRAENEGADFITLGPIYETPSKKKYGPPVGIRILKQVKSKVSVPVIAIGGITLENAQEVLQVHADGMAVISALLSALNIHDTAKAFRRLLI